jgi:hypothetical protein
MLEAKVVAQADRIDALVKANNVLLKELNVLLKEIVELKKDRDHWKANHYYRVQAIHIVLDRPDLPLDRLAAYHRYLACLKELDMLKIKRGIKI